MNAESELTSSLPDQNPHRRNGVVVAITRENGKFLCIRRARNLVRAPGKVCFPGGMIEPGETQAEAVRREMKEELGIDVNPLRLCWHYDLPNSDLTLWGWTAHWAAGELIPLVAEVEEAFWLTGEEVSQHVDAMDTNPLFVKCLLDVVR
jgi:8-oxo-dGTP diphosphatase